MAKKTEKPLLNEGTIRRMMKLANMEALGNGFISETYSQIGEEEEPLTEQPEEMGAEEEVDVEMPEEAPEEAPEEDSEVTITDEEAQDIIALGDKLKDAVGEDAPEEAPEDEMPPEPEMEMDDEEEAPGNRGMTYEGEDNEELYEAALRGLDVDLVDDSAEKKKAMLQEIKSRIYKRVVSRLLKETKKTTK